MVLFLVTGCAHCSLERHECLDCDYTLKREPVSVKGAKHTLTIQVVDGRGRKVGSEGLCPELWQDRGVRFGPTKFKHVGKGRFEGKFPAWSRVWVYLSIRTKAPLPIGRAIYEFKSFNEDKMVTFTLHDWRKHVRRGRAGGVERECQPSGTAGGRTNDPPVVAKVMLANDTNVVPKMLSIAVVDENGDAYRRDEMCVEVWADQMLKPLGYWATDSDSKTSRAFYISRGMLTGTGNVWSVKAHWNKAGIKAPARGIRGGVPTAEVELTVR